MRGQCNIKKNITITVGTFDFQFVISILIIEYYLYKKNMTINDSENQKSTKRTKNKVQTDFLE